MKMKITIATSLLLVGLVAAYPGGHGKRVKDVRHADVNGDGQITLEEFQAMTQSQFEKMDANGDGVLSEEEMGRRRFHMRRMAKAGPHLLKAADNDGDGALSSDELDAFLTQVADESGENINPTKVAEILGHDLDRIPENAPTVSVEQIRTMFDHLDSNDDGVVSEDEQPRYRMRRQFGERGKRGSERSMRHRGGSMMIFAADTDGETGISADEWASFLSTIDGDGDGVFTVQDFLATVHQNANREPSERMLEMLTARLDNDDDGVLETADLQYRFDHADANGDGALTEDELPKRRRHTRRR